VTASYLIYVYAAVVGLVVGSYLNVLIYRLPRGESTVWSRSHCPYCAGTIRVRDNLPLVSFLLLRGQCRYCGAPISWRYPLVEAATATLFVSCVLRFGISPRAIIAAVFGCLMILLAVIDLEHFLLPDRITMPGILTGLAVSLWLPRTSFLDAVVGALVGAGILILVINFWYWLREEEGMGMGDVNMMALIGAFLGWQGVLTALGMAAFAGSLVGLGLLVTRRGGLRSRLPFGTFLAFGALFSLFVGDGWLDLYGRLL
jgi:leader peptidase (prepilin peptidase)/N-methyltransferase